MRDLLKCPVLARAIKSSKLGAMARFYRIVLLGTLSCGNPGSGRPPIVNTSVPEPVLPNLTRACAGSHLDLKWMAEGQSRCESPDHSLVPKDPRLVESIDPPEIQIAPSEGTHVDYVVSNPTRESLTFDFPNLSCRADLELLVLDESGRRVQEDCLGGGGCSMPNARVVLEPGADARYRLSVRAVTQTRFWADDRCALHPAQPLSPGSYSLKPSSGLFDDLSDLRGSMTVISGLD